MTCKVFKSVVFLITIFIGIQDNTNGASFEITGIPDWIGHPEEIAVVRVSDQKRLRSGVFDAKNRKFTFSSVKPGNYKVLIYAFGNLEANCVFAEKIKVDATDGKQVTVMDLGKHIADELARQVAVKMQIAFEGELLSRLVIPEYNKKVIVVKLERIRDGYIDPDFCEWIHLNRTDGSSEFTCDTKLAPEDYRISLNPEGSRPNRDPQSSPDLFMTSFSVSGNGSILRLSFGCNQATNASKK